MPTWRAKSDSRPGRGLGSNGNSPRTLSRASCCHLPPTSGMSVHRVEIGQRPAKGQRGGRGRGVGRGRLRFEAVPAARMMLSYGGDVEVVAPYGGAGWAGGREG